MAMRRKLTRIIRSAWIISGIGVMTWLYAGFQAAGVPGDTLTSDPQVSMVMREDGVDFRGLVNPRRSGVIFLPGGMVDPAAYTPLMKRIARAGYRARLLYLPLRCACTDSQTAQLFESIEALMSAEADTSWILAGHSRGGMLASRFVHESDVEPAGLVLIGTTHPRDFSLGDIPMPVTKIYGTQDGIAPYAAMLKNKHLLPSKTTWVEIQGGNHVQFGYYRHQFGDGAATISRAQQQEAVERALLNALAAANQAAQRCVPPGLPRPADADAMRLRARAAIRLRYGYAKAHPSVRPAVLPSCLGPKQRRLDAGTFHASRNHRRGRALA